MYLKSIEVQGFKSFAHKIKFEFHNGITGIVGPNGSGKSNVADAVRWVFGEQSAKQLRGSSMQDVIFAGTQLRKPQSFASVSITLDNSDRALNFDADEVTVQRKVYRSGESEYIMNDSQCRLRDINELFYDTGIGKEGYSIIGQGQIDRILSGKADERRELFDEAAGIVKYKKRKTAAIKKLESERESMVRVTDIMTELERQVGPLSRQSETAKQYLKLRDELKVYDINAFLLDHTSISAQLTKAETDLENVERELSEKQAEDDALRKEYVDLDENVQNLDNRIEQVRTRVNEAQDEKSELQSRINVISEQINTEKINSEHYEARRDEISEEIKGKEGQIRDAEEEKAVKTDELTVLQMKSSEKNFALHQEELKVDAFRRTIEDSHGRVVDLLTEKSEVNAKLQHLSTLLEQNAIRKSEYETKIADLEKQGASLNEEIGTLEEESTEKAKNLSELQVELSKAQDELHDTQEEYQSVQREINDFSQKYQIAKSRLDTLRSMAERYEGFNPAVRRVMDVKSSYKGICGVVADLIQVETKYRTAIEIALGGNVQNIVTETEDSAKKLVEYLKENRAGRATFLPLDAIKPTGGISDPKILSEKGVIGSADKLVKADKKYDAVVRYLLERFLAVDTLENALAVAKKYRYTVRIVTLEGEFLNVGGSISGGAFKSSNNILSRNSELEALEKEAEASKKKSDELSIRLNQLRQIRESTVVEIEDIQEDIQTANAEFSDVKARLDSKRREITALALEKKENESRIRESEDERITAETEKEAILVAMAELESRGSESNEAADQTKALLSEAEEAYNVLLKEAEELNLQISQNVQHTGFLTDTVERLSQEIAKLLEDQETLKINAASSVSIISAHQEEIELLRTGLQEVTENTDELQGTLDGLLHEREDISQSQREFFDKRDVLNTVISDLSREQIRLEAQQEKLEEKLSAQTEYLWTEYELTPSEAENYKSSELIGESPTAIRRHASELKGKIKALGNVNVNAIDQYKEVAERYEFLKGQYEDLVSAEKSLTDVIDDLDNGMRKQFKEKFEEINVEFDKVFKELFGGGQGTLSLQPDVDIIDADISIISQPPGKKLQNMMQLSGGEKALTAIALIFAIYNLKPSPFCLLDEIEAALDDSNVGRFNTYLRNLTKKTQFILITHRRGTMVAADRLYGITMQEKGVSTLVSVNLVEQDLDA